MKKPNKRRPDRTRYVRKVWSDYRHSGFVVARVETIGVRK